MSNPHWVFSSNLAFFSLGWISYSSILARWLNQGLFTLGSSPVLFVVWRFRAAWAAAWGSVLQRPLLTLGLLSLLFHVCFVAALFRLAVVMRTPVAWCSVTLTYFLSHRLAERSCSLLAPCILPPFTGLEHAGGDEKVIVTKVPGTVKWVSVKNQYEFINWNDSKEDIFVHQL